MPIAELGYRSWEGARVPALRRWLAITRSHVRIALRGSKLLQRFLIFAWMPLLYFAPIFFAIGYAADPSNDLSVEGPLQAIADEILSGDVISRLRQQPERILPALWATSFYNFFWMTQSILAMIVVAIVAPPLVSRDLRNKAFLLYFSKPIGICEYLCGKAGVVLFFCFSITLFPALVLYAISIALSPDAGTLIATTPILLRIVLASLVIGIPVSMIALLFSSLTRDHRVAAFLWMAFWIFGEITYHVIAFGLTDGAGVPATNWGFLASLREVVTTATAGVLDLHGYQVELIETLRDAGLDERVLRSLGSLQFSQVSQQAFAEALGDVEAPDVRPTTLAIGYLAGVSAMCAVILRRRILQPVRI